MPALAAAQRPVIYAGGGVVNANASEELVEFATSDRFPVTCTLMGLGAFPATVEGADGREPNPQWLGMLGMHGTRSANYAMDEADLICAVGARFDDRVTGKLSEFAPHAKFIHIDVDPAEISKNIPAHIPIVGDVRGAGFFHAIELVKDQETKAGFSDEESESLLRGYLSGELYKRGLICRADDRGDPVVQLAPPLIADTEQFEEIHDVLSTVLAEAWERVGR